MKYIELPESKAERLSFYLAMEEFAARCLDEAECFFMWQVNPTVIFGRNQLIDNEVNLEYCRANRIELYRRKSGGGCVYADRGNVMFSYIAQDSDVRLAFGRHLRKTAAVLRELGADAKVSGRNDICVGGRKVSGNAFYHVAGKSIVHGTMLFDTNLENMARALTPSAGKLLSKGVGSVRQHVANLAEYIPVGIEEFKSFVRRRMCDGTITLSPGQVRSIGEIEKEYASEEFIYGSNPRYAFIKKGRTAKAGEFELRMELKNGIIKKLNVSGDYFLTGDLDKELTARLRNVPYEETAVRRALKDARLEDVILHLTEDEWIQVMFS